MTEIEKRQISDYILTDEEIYEKVKNWAKSQGFYDDMEQKPTQKSEEWYKLRKGRVTGSVAAGCIEECPYNTDIELVASRILGEIPYPLPNFWMQRGIMLEGKVKEKLPTYLNCIYGFEINDIRIEEAPLYVCAKYPWIASSPDGIIYVKDKAWAVLEVKCPVSKRKDVPFEVPQHYKIQCNMHMMCTGIPQCFFISWRFAKYDYELLFSDEKEESRIIKKINKFIYKHLIK